VSYKYRLRQAADLHHSVSKDQFSQDNTDKKKSTQTRMSHAEFEPTISKVAIQILVILSRIREFPG